MLLLPLVLARLAVSVSLCALKCDVFVVAVPATASLRTTKPSWQIWQQYRVNWLRGDGIDKAIIVSVFHRGYFIIHLDWIQFYLKRASEKRRTIHSAARQQSDHQLISSFLSFHSYFGGNDWTDALLPSQVHRRGDCTTRIEHLLLSSF